jgi:uroporphyrinogen-III synthase
MRTILLTRSHEENERMAPTFRNAGFQTMSLPGIEIAEPEDWTATDAAISGLETYDGVFFTSKNAVHAFLRRLDAIRHDGREVLGRSTIAAVGEKTSEVLESEGLVVAVTPEVGSADQLIASLSDLGLTGKRLLFPKSSIARDLIPAALREGGADVEEIIVYRNLAPAQESLDSIREGLLDGRVDAVTFFSPSAVRNVVQMLGSQCLGSVFVCVIGPTTAAAVRGAGLEPHLQAAEPTTESLVHSLTEHFSHS